VSSGHSIIKAKAEWSGHDQLICVPGYAEISRSEVLADRLRQSPTQWFFTWGMQERGTYRIEAQEQRTAKVISDLPNAIISFFDEGHVFPVEAISQLLNTVTAKSNNK